MMRSVHYESILTECALDSAFRIQCSSLFAVLAKRYVENGGWLAHLLLSQRGKVTITPTEGALYESARDSNHLGPSNC